MRLFRSVLKVAVLPGLLAIAVGAYAQQEPTSEFVPVLSVFESPIDPANAVKAVLAPEDIGNLIAAGAVVRVDITAFKSGNCLAMVDVGAVVTTRSTMPRAAGPIKGGYSERRGNEAKEAVCERALISALNDLKGGKLLPVAWIRDNVESTSSTKRPDPAKSGERRVGSVLVAHSGSLNQAGVNLVAEVMRPRWPRALDNRYFGASFVLMTGKTDRGDDFCAVRHGLTARPADGVDAKVPVLPSYQVLIAGPGKSCERQVVVDSAAALRDSIEHLLKDRSMIEEQGIKYPTSAQILNALAAVDADQRKEAAQAKAKAEREASQAGSRTTTSRTSSRNRTTCTNECINGQCVRTFPDGRKERWTAPRVYSPLKSDWEYDIQTNPCGL